MQKTTKGALAAGAAAVLLLGGAGSLAYWTDDATVNGGSITSGSLSLDAVSCDPYWNHDNGTASGDPVVTFVPGDIISKDCRFTVGAVGDNLSASPGVPDTVTINTTPSGTSFDATVAATYDLNGVAFGPTSHITEDDDSATLTAHLVVTIPRGTDQTGAPLVNANDTQNITASLADLTVTLTQDTF